MAENNESDKDQILNRLINDAAGQMKASFTRPSDDIILAYIAGNADPKESEIMRSVLLASSEFRKEILEIAADLGAASDQETQIQINNLPDPKIPDLSAYVGSPWQVKKSESKDSLWQRLVGFFTPMKLVPVAAVAGTALLVLLLKPVLFDHSTISHRVIKPLIAASNLDPAYLVRLHMRGEKDLSEQQIYGSAQEAALAEIRRHLSYQAGSFRFHDTVQESLPDSHNQYIALQFLSESDKRIGNCNIPMAKSLVMGSGGLQGWLITIPERNLLRLDSLADTTAVIWQGSWGRSGCVAITVQRDSGFISLGGNCFQLQTQAVKQ